MADDLPSGATPHAKSNALCNVGMFLVVFGVVVSVFDLPFVRADVSPNQIFWAVIIAGSLCFISSAYLKSADFVAFVKAAYPLRSSDAP